MVSNVAVLCASLLLSYVLVNEHIVHPVSRLGIGLPANEIGKALTLQGVDWSANGQTLLLVVSSHCGFCVRSTPFWHKLSLLKISHHLNTKFVAASYEKPNTILEFLQQHDIRVDGVVSTPLSDLGVEATPTLMLVDSHGKVLNEWIGLLDNKGEDRIISELN